MLFLLDENIPGHTEEFLHTSGHEIIRSSKRAKDREIAGLAASKGAILLTRDRDFLNFLPTPFSGIVYVSIHPSIAEHITEAVRNLFGTTKEEWLRGKVIVLSRKGYEIFR